MIESDDQHSQGQIDQNPSDRSEIPMKSVPAKRERRRPYSREAQDTNTRIVYGKTLLVPESFVLLLPLLRCSVACLHQAQRVSALRSLIRWLCGDAARHLRVSRGIVERVLSKGEF